MSHSHHHSHSHGPTETTSEKNLFITMGLNFLITIAEVIGGVISGSLSLISDALHNFSDGIAIIITYIALKLSKKPKSFRYTFGMKRAEVLAAIINAGTLIIISFFLIKEAIFRFGSPEPITGGVMLVVGIIGLLPNIIGALLLRGGAKESMNIRSAYFHLLSDTIFSVAVIIGAVFIIYFEIYWIDPVLTIIMSIYIIYETFKIVKEAVDIMMMSTPAEIDIAEIKSVLEALPAVLNIHHVHIWRLNEHTTHFEAHIEVNDMTVSQSTEMQKEIEHLLHENFEITHTTLQFECSKCDNKSVV